MDMESGLPSGWVVRFSKSRRIPYYFNTTTQDSQWEPPHGVDEAKLAAYMGKNFPAPNLTAADGSSGAGKIRCAHLLVKHKGVRRPSSWKSPVVTRTLEEARAMIRGFEERIRSGSVQLGELAETESDCSSARKKGDLGFFGRGEMQEKFETPAFQLAVGEISGPVETASGVHLIQRLQ